ncbi:MAG: AraC family transcriptional regulator [Vicinamibacterales bacterium]|nr:AraC family transcriptional regulator [Vicinamibacterales bacterium]
MTELLLDLNQQRPPMSRKAEADPELGPMVVPWDDTFAYALQRLLELLDEPAALPALGSGRLRELLYVIMRGPAGPSLWRTLGQVHDLNHTLSYIRDHAHEPLSIDDLAQRAGMSRAVFDRRFRAATTYAPLQFIKALRLNDAALQIAEGSDITDAALNVGYASPAQFSRDFKRQYGTAPKQWSRSAEASSVTV